MGAVLLLRACFYALLHSSFTVSREEGRVALLTALSCEETEAGRMLLSQLM